MFARQVSEASAATARAEAMVAANAAQRTEIAGLERELERIQRQRFILQQARGYGLGGRQGDRVHARAGRPAAARRRARLGRAFGSAPGQPSARSSAG